MSKLIGKRVMIVGNNSDCPHPHPMRMLGTIRCVYPNTINPLFQIGVLWDVPNPIIMPMQLDEIRYLNWKRVKIDEHE